MFFGSRKWGAVVGSNGEQWVEDCVNDVASLAPTYFVSLTVDKRVEPHVFQVHVGGVAR